ncbi:MAG: wax ester/triacylglycerol synthase domain-containing protein [Microthrixaceae bacterium]
MSTEPTSLDNGPSVTFEDRMSDQDALMWSIEKDPMLRSTVTTLMVLDGEVRSDQLHHTFDRLSRIIPRLRQRVRGNPLSLAPPRWEVDPNFDLRYHLRSARVPGSGSMADLLTMAGPIAMQGFDRARPLWEATIVEGLSGKKSAIILKFHHSITDGVGGVELMLELFELAPDAEERTMPHAPDVHVLNQSQRFLNAFQHESRRQLSFALQLSSAGASSVRDAISDPSRSAASSAELLASAGRILRPEGTPMSAIMTRRTLSNSLDVLSMPLDLAKKVGHLIGGTINDTFLTGIARGMSLYHQHHGAEQGTLRMGMPINIRGDAPSTTSGNSFVPARFEIQIDFEDLTELMTHIRERAIAARDEPANQLVEPLSGILNKLPTTVVTQIFGSMMRGLDFQASNVPGSPIPIYLQGIPVSAVYPFGPLAGAAVNVTLLSYQNELNIGVNLDPAAVPDADVFMECLRTAYDELLDLI